MARIALWIVMKNKDTVKIGTMNEPCASKVADESFQNQQRGMQQSLERRNKALQEQET